MIYNFKILTFTMHNYDNQLQLMPYSILRPPTLAIEDQKCAGKLILTSPFVRPRRNIASNDA